MTSRDFAYWMQGYFEIAGASDEGLSPEQVACIKRHLALVFVHEIDPSMGDKARQDLLKTIHDPPIEVHDPRFNYPVDYPGEPPRFMC